MYRDLMGSDELGMEGWAENREEGTGGGAFGPVIAGGGWGGPARLDWRGLEGQGTWAGSHRRGPGKASPDPVGKFRA